MEKRLKIQAVVICFSMFFNAAFPNNVQAGNGRLLKPALGIMKVGTAATVGAVTKWSGTVQLVATSAVHTQAYLEVKANLESSNVPLEIRERYLSSLLKHGSAEDFGNYVDQISPMNRQKQLKREIDKLKKEAGEDQYSWQRNNRISQIEGLERQKKEAETEYAQATQLVNSYGESLEKLKSEEGRSELRQNLNTIRENLGENYDMQDDNLTDFGTNITNDLVTYATGEVTGALISGGLGEVIEGTGVLPQLQFGICPESAELTAGFVTDMAGMMIGVAGEQAGVPIQVPLGLQEFAGSLLDINAEMGGGEIENYDLIGMNSELEVIDGMSLEGPAELRSINPNMIRIQLARVRRSNPAVWQQTAAEKLMTLPELERTTHDPSIGIGFKIDRCLKYQNQRIARTWAGNYSPTGIRPPGQVYSSSMFVTRIPSGNEYQAYENKRLQKQQQAIQTMQAIGAIAGAIAAASQPSSKYDAREGRHVSGTCGRR